MKIKVYLEDTDAGGIVYHASYLRFMERARTEFIHQLGLNAVDLPSRLFVVRRILIEYFVPAQLGDELDVQVELNSKRRCAVNFAQKIVRIKDKMLVCYADVQIVCIDAISRRPCPLPPQIATIG